MWSARYPAPVPLHFVDRVGAPFDNERRQQRSIVGGTHPVLRGASGTRVGPRNGCGTTYFLSTWWRNGQITSVSLPIVRYLLEVYPESIYEVGGDDDASLAVHGAIWSGAPLELVRLLVERYPGSLEVWTAAGNLALHVAVAYDVPFEMLVVTFAKGRRMDAAPPCRGPWSTDGSSTHHQDGHEAAPCPNRLSLEAPTGVLLSNQEPNGIHRKEAVVGKGGRVQHEITVSVRIYCSAFRPLPEQSAGSFRGTSSARD